MAEIDAKVLLSYDVSRKINWLTKNCPTEIGAMGTVSVKKNKATGDKYFYVEKLLFTKQRTSGATVNIEKEMWQDVIREASVEDLCKLNFYWHKHPGCAHHSHTDEEDTFGTFMSQQAQERKYFIFLQTAINSQKVFNHEARVDIRNPVRCTIKNENVEVLQERHPDELKYEIECKKIMEECIVKNIPSKKKFDCSTALQKYGKDLSNHKQNIEGVRRIFNAYDDEEADDSDVREYYRKLAKEDLLEDVQTLKKVFNVEANSKNHLSVDNDRIGNIATSHEEKASFSTISGSVEILAGKHFQQVIDSALAENGRLKKVITRHSSEEANTKGLKKYKLTPKSKGYWTLIKHVTDVFLDYNLALRKTIMSDVKNNANEETQHLIEHNVLTGEYVPEKKDSVTTFALLDIVPDRYNIAQKRTNELELRDYETEHLLGIVHFNDKWSEIKRVQGTDAIKIVKDVEEYVESHRDSLSKKYQNKEG